MTTQPPNPPLSAVAIAHTWYQNPSDEVRDIEAYAAQQCAEKDKRIAELEELIDKQKNIISAMHDDCEYFKKVRNQAITDVKLLREAMVPILEVTDRRHDLWDKAKEALAATDKEVYRE